MLLFILTTYSRVFKLFTKSFIAVLPFNLFYAFADFLLNTFMPLNTPASNDEFIPFAAHISISTILFTLFFVFILIGVYQKHKDQQTNYGYILLNGMKRVLSVLGSVFIVILPIIIMALILNFISEIFETLAPTEQHQITTQLIIMSFVLFLFFAGMIFWMGYCFYFYVSTIYIIIFKQNALQALKNSRQLIHNYWFKTFMLVFLLLFICTIVEIFLFKLINDAAFALISLFVLPLSACLMTIHFEQLSNRKENLE